MILAIDAGNTRLKWAIFDAGGRRLQQGAEDNARLAALSAHAAAWATCRKALVSCVAGPAVESLLRAMFESLGMPVQWVRASAEACGVRNGYRDPHQLGSDRWLALIAAWHHCRGPCVLASAGSALTVDALSSDGVFLGGWIIPGLRLQQQALVAGTAGVRAGEGVCCEYPDNTADALFSGAVSAMAGAVERMVASLLEREGQQPRCLLAGGDAELIRRALHLPGEILDNPVLQGLYLIESETA